MFISAIACIAIFSAVSSHNEVNEEYLNSGMVAGPPVRIECSCSDSQEDPVEFPEGAPSGKDLEWTFLLYDDADFNNAYDPIDDFRAEFTSGDGVEVIVLQDTYSSEAFLYRVAPDGSLELLESLGEINMGDDETLNEFIDYAKQNYIANRYMLAMYDHGGGWAGACYDETSSYDILTMEEIKYAIDLAGGIDILAFTAPCLMGALESAYEVNGCVDIYIGSEELSGYYLWKGKMDEICAYMKSNHGASSTAIADYIIDQISDNLVPPYFEGGTLCATVPDSLVPLIMELDELSEYIELNIDALGENIESARSEAFEMGEQYGYQCGEIDFCHFLQVYSSKESDPIVQNHINNLLPLYDTAIINECHGVLVPDATGLSIFFPPEPEGYYFYVYCNEPLNMLADTHWEEALTEYYEWLEMGIEGQGESTATAVRSTSNPCLGNIGIICVCQGTGDATLTVMDLAGRQVFSSNFYALAGESVEVQWNTVSSSPPGLYLLRLDSPDGTTASCRVFLLEQMD